MNRIILFLILTTVPFFNYADEVIISEAKQVGINYMSYVNNEFNTDVVEEITISYQNYDVIYAFNFKRGGYILISADDIAYPILSYSFEGKFIENDKNIPAAYTSWMQWYKDQIILTKTTNIKPLAKTIYAWKKFSVDQIGNNKSVTMVNPLLDIDNIKWGQGCYFNADCPIDAAGACNHVYVGCVATAMVQIMRYHKFPDSGSGSHSFNDSYGTQSANFGSAYYDWNSMPGQVTSSNAEVAKISYHAGVSVDMSYSASGSGAYSSTARTALVNYFTYSNDATYVTRTYYSDLQWKSMINASLDNNWPVYYSGNDGSSGGHAFVCDGYNDNDEYHFNWGWTGGYNSWNTLDDIVPGGTGAGGGSGDYSQGNKIIYNIHPYIGLNANFNCDITNIPEGDQVNYNDISTDGGSAITSWSWTFTGGTPSSYNGQNPPAITYNTAGTYPVSLTVTNSGGSDTETKTSYITVVPVGDLFSLDFELPENYSQIFAPWSNIDNDGKDTYGSSDCDFPGEGSAFGFMAFNPSDASFSLAGTHAGQRCGMAICPADASAADNWIISEEIPVTSSSDFIFWVLTPKPGSWGNETFNVLVSTTDNNLTSFSAIATGVEAPSSWTQKTYSLSAYSGQDVYVAIQHVSADKFMFLIDDIEITGIATNAIAFNDKDINIYPNPTNGEITIENIANANIEITDINGRIVISKFANSNILNLDLSKLDRGTYFVRIINYETVSIKNIIVK